MICTKTSKSQSHGVFEIWQSQAAVDEHGATAHFQSFLHAIDGKTETVDIVLLNNLSDNANQ